MVLLQMLRAKKRTKSPYPIAFSPSFNVSANLQMSPPLNSSGVVLTSCHISVCLLFQNSNVHFRLSISQLSFNYTTSCLLCMDFHIIYHYILIFNYFPFCKFQNSQITILYQHHMLYSYVSYFLMCIYHFLVILRLTVVFLEIHHFP